MSNTPPPPLPYQPADPYTQITSNLQTLSIFYFIFCGIYALVALLALLYVAFGVLIGLLGATSSNSGDAGAAAVFGGLFACLGVVFSLFFGTISFLYYKAGRGLRNRRSLTIIYIVAVLACLNLPLGTILGIFTFVVLSKPGVKESFT